MKSACADAGSPAPSAHEHPMPPPILVTFAGGSVGRWRVDSAKALVGEPLPAVSRLDVYEQSRPVPGGVPVWSLRGATSNSRYTQRVELSDLAALQKGLGRPDAICAALIPIRKNAAWWDLAQDERRAIFQETSRHISIGMDYLPGVARRLHHSRELGEPFDFLTWFEFAPAHEPAFAEMLDRLRATAEWEYVDREIDLRLRLD